MNSRWGGKREGAGSGGKREGAGRPRTTWKTEGQKRWIVVTQSIQGDEHVSVWELLNIERNGTIEFQNTEDETIISIIHPEEYE